MYRFSDIVTTDKRMLANIQKAKLMKDETFPVLIYGETGTGKELFAQAIHSESNRRNAPFVAQNCSNLPEGVFESMLWGVEKGAFTGAVERPGLFEEADGGTLFIDEINSLSLHLQSKLLRVIENFKVLRVGASRTRTVSVRILTAMNDTPQNVLAKNMIRKDLFFRLSTGCLEMAPLRERKCDIKLYIDYYIKIFNEKYGKSIQGISKELEILFYEHSWPGNVREMMHVLESASCIAKGAVIQKEDIPEYYHLAPLKPCNEDHAIKDDMSSVISCAAGMIKNSFSVTEGFGLESVVSSFEKEMIQAFLVENHGNLSKTAKILCIPRQTLKYKVDRYGISVKE